jgi:hypothetical protein
MCVCGELSTGDLSYNDWKSNPETSSAKLYDNHQWGPAGDGEPTKDYDSSQSVHALLLPKSGACSHLSSASCLPVLL